jgi:hypothetical protein
MKVGHLLCEQGVSGDMWIGALVAAGAKVEVLQSAVDGLGLGQIKLVAHEVRSHGLMGTRVEVHVPEDTRRLRRLSEVEAVFESATTPEPVLRKALAVYHALGQAEATAHGSDLADVHFHELGHADTAADIVASCAGVLDLGLERITTGRVAVGAGSINTDHGRVAVPPPAVRHLLTGFTIVDGEVTRELTTPTGAALLAQLTAPAPLGPFRMTGAGTGLARPRKHDTSTLTLLVGDAREQAPTETAVLIEATIDDLNPELVPYVLDQLREQGAHDSWATPALMKKGRQGWTLTALASAASLGRLREVLYREGGTLGVRWHDVVKHPLDRRWIDVDVDGVTVKVKIAESDGEVVTVAPEFDDVSAAARLLGSPARDIYNAAISQARIQLT